MEKYVVTVVELKTKKELKLEIVADEAETTENIVLAVTIDGEEFSASNYSYLPAYQKLRDALLQKGYGIKCNGSRLNAVQSGMMGANDNIYLAETGKQALKEDIVSIYDYADIEEFPDTLAQMRFFRNWLKSLTEKKTV